MEKFLPVLQRSPLFAGISEQDMETMLDCLGAVERKFSRGEAVLRAGEPARWLGVVPVSYTHLEGLDAPLDALSDEECAKALYELITR